MARPRATPKRTTGGTGPMMLAVSMKRNDAQAFLKKLAENDGFRRSFERNPHAALERVGVVVPKGALPGTVRLSRATVQEFVRTGFVGPDGGGPRPRPYNGGCRVWSVLYAIASQAKP